MGVMPGTERRGRKPQSGQAEKGQQGGREKTERKRHTQRKTEKESEIETQSGGSLETHRQRETEDERAEDDAERGGSGPRRAAAGRAAESPLCSCGPSRTEGLSSQAVGKRWASKPPARCVDGN